MQKHPATRLHWDLRLEWDGVLLSWAVTRGPSAAPSAKRLAVRTEDHPLDYATFEGTIPKPEYGAGSVMLWDRGTWAPLGDVDAGLAEGMLKFVLSGERMRGAWMLVRLKPRAGEKRENWLLIKENDTHVADDPEGLITTHLTSVSTGRTMIEIAGGTTAKARPRAQARPLKSPPFRPVQLAKLQTVVPTGDDWLHEVKVDGYRCLAALGGGSVRLFTRNGLDWTTQFAALVLAFEAVPCKSALIDGEVTAAGADPRPYDRGEPGFSGGLPRSILHSRVAPDWQAPSLTNGGETICKIARSSGWMSTRQQFPSRLRRASAGARCAIGEQSRTGPTMSESWWKGWVLTAPRCISATRLGRAAMAYTVSLSRWGTTASWLRPRSFR